MEEQKKQQLKIALEKGYNQSEKFNILVSIVGTETAIKIIDKLNGHNVNIPTSDTLITAYRNRCILNDYKAGLSYSDIADKYNSSVIGMQAVISGLLERE